MFKRHALLCASCIFLTSLGYAFAEIDTAPEQTQPQDHPTTQAADTAPPPTITPRSVRIGAWNIEWLTQPDKRYGDAQGKTQTAEDIADYIGAARVEVLALEEICPTNLANPFEYDPEVDGPLDNSVLREALATLSKKTRSDWQFRLFPNNGTTRATNQLTGIAWDANKLTVLGESWQAIEYDKSKRQYWYRPPYATAFSTGEGMTDLVIIPIHMKAYDDESSANQRAMESAELVQALADNPGDPDVLIIGDSNCHRGDEQAIKNYAAAGFIDLNRRDLSTHVGNAPLDRVFIPDGQPEFAKKFFQVFDKPYLARRRLQPNGFHERYSDHYMVITTVKAGVDDD